MPESESRRRAWNLVVASGGDSDEREISLQSGAAVAQALRTRGHAVRLLDPAFVNLDACDWSGVDACFLALHGRFGEDGGVQEILDRLEVPYTGSNAAVSRTAFSKSASKERFLQCEVPTPDYALIHQSDTESRIGRLARGLGFPLVVKPDAQGSSLGISIVHQAADLMPAVAHCFAFGSFGLLERAVPGTEWTVPLLDDQALPIIQIETQRSFFDFSAKYEDEATGYRFDFELPASVIRTIEDAGVRASAALETRGLARVDVRVDPAGCPWVLEVNTIPGMTDHSLVPKSAVRRGWSLGELCERAIDSALRSATRQKNRQKSPVRSGNAGKRHAG